MKEFMIGQNKITITKKQNATKLFIISGLKINKTSVEIDNTMLHS